MKRPSIQRIAVSPVALAIVLAGARPVAGAVIPVTTVQQKISSTGGCSLQEAIYSANYDASVAVIFNGTTPVLIQTQCVAGSGDDSIVLPAGAVFHLSNIVDDADNPTGPTATPIIFSNITLFAYGAILERTGSKSFRLFAVHPMGRLTIKKAHIRGFRAQGGNGGLGGGGGMGAGGAIYVMSGSLAVEASTFSANFARGGSGGDGLSGGGGGIGGNGGVQCYNAVNRGGTGGGGSRGNGSTCGGPSGGGGGGTVFNAASRPRLHLRRARRRLRKRPGRTVSRRRRRRRWRTLHRRCFVRRWQWRVRRRWWWRRPTTAAALVPAAGSVVVAAPRVMPESSVKTAATAGLVEVVAQATTAMSTDGNPGNGGFFGGNGRSEAGGGGAGLGGAIFNDSGIVVISNSTFTANGAVGGLSLGGAPEGRAGGGAIFSRNGQLTVLNATINGNSSVIGLGGGIMVAQDSPSAPTLFVLQNTIVANNGEAECAVTGSSIAGAFAGNLITQNAIGQIMREKTFVACPGVVTTADPQLAPLALNTGPTPTMAIAASSPAWNTADFGTSLGFDQRGQRRPALGGVDIGAFELCLQNLLDVQLPCVIAGFEESPGGGEAVQLTIDVDPPGSGTTVPAEGTISVAASSPVALTATPNPGYRFTGWSPDVADPANPSTVIFVNFSQTVIAGFEACSCAEDVTQFDRPHLQRFHDQPDDEAVRADGDAQEQFVHPDCRTGVAGARPADGERHALQPQWRYVADPAGRKPVHQRRYEPVAGTKRFGAAAIHQSGNVAVTYQARVLAGPGSR